MAGRYSTVSEVRLAAAVILARSPMEVYLTRRSARSPFAPDAFVFPGGTLDAADSSAETAGRSLGLESERVAREFRAGISPLLPSSEPAVEAVEGRALLIAALRELFEEAGILLARDRAGQAVVPNQAQRRALAAERHALRDGELTFAELLARRDWFADTNALTLFSHWITPPSEPRRYNTHFFFAVAPPEQAPLADAYETHDGIWIAPDAALARYREGAMHLVYPTIKHLNRLRGFDSIESAAAFARSKPVVTIMPFDDDAGDFRIPPDLEEAW